MPYQIYQDGEILRIDLTGVASNAEIAQMYMELQHIETKAAIVPHRIADLSQCSRLDINSHAVMAMIKLRKALKLPNAIKTAIVAPQPKHQEFVRMLAELNSHPQKSIQTFPDLEAARRWIVEE